MHTLFFETGVLGGSAAFYRRNDDGSYKLLSQADLTRPTGRLWLTYINQEIRVREEPNDEPLILYQDPNPREVWSVGMYLNGEAVMQIYQPCF